MIKVLHTGDLHLDSAFGGLAPERARQRREEQRELLETLAALVREEGVQVVLLAGDLFDGDAVYYETALMLSEALGRMDAHIFIAPGNHDPYGPHSPYTQIRWPERVHIFRTPSMERVVLPELGCVVYGCAFSSHYRESAPLEGFQPQQDEGLTRLMVLHGDLSGRGNYGPITPEQLERTGVDYAALGHVHRFTEVWRRGATSFAYCGCPEGRGFDETGDKGVLLGVVEPGRAEMRFRTVCRRRYQIAEVPVTGKDPAQALESAACAMESRDICRFVFTGLRRDGALDLDALRTLVEDRFFAVQLRDRTRQETDPWARLGEDTLTGLFLRNLRGRLDQASEEERPVLERALEYGLAALEGREEPG